MNTTDKIIVKYHGHEVGKIALTPKGLCAFEYSPEWIAGGFSISPFELPLKDGVFIARPNPFGGGFGIFDDSLPDGWGLLILDRYLQKKGVNIRCLSILDRLALVGSTGRGALEFEPDRSVMSDNDFSDFTALALDASKILSSDTYDGSGIEDFQRLGGSPGGARPKIFVKADDSEWLVKFRALHDPVDIGLTEYRYSLLASQCGVTMPRTRLFEDKYFATERYDRSADGEKIHVASVAGLLCADYRIPSIDYSHIFKVGAALTRNIDELKKIFKLMAFNFLIGNKDDHAKNFSFLYKDNEWSLAPGYDLLPGEGMNGYHSTSINDKITPAEDDLIAVASMAGLQAKESKRCINEMRMILAEAGGI